MTGNVLKENLPNKFRNMIGFKDSYKSWGAIIMNGHFSALQAWRVPGNGVVKDVITHPGPYSELVDNNGLYILFWFLTPPDKWSPDHGQ